MNTSRQRSLPTVTVTAKRPDPKVNHYAWAGSFDPMMSMTPNQLISPLYRTSQQYDADLKYYTQTLPALFEDVVEAEAEAIEFAFTFGFSAASQPGKYVFKQGFQNVIKKKAVSNTIKRLTKSQKRAIKSLKDQIAKHKQKLEDYLNDPYKYDHRGILKDAPAERVEKIIESRARHLESEIKTFQENIKKIINGY